MANSDETGRGSAERAWDELTMRADPNPFCRPQWFHAWWNAFGEGARMEVFMVRRAERIAAAGPVLWRGRTAQYPGNVHTPECTFPADDAGARRDLVDAVLDRRPRTFTVPTLRDDDPLLDDLAAATARHPYRLLRVAAAESPVVDLEGVDDPLMLLSGRRRQELRRLRRRLEERGDLRFDLITGGPGLDERLAEAFAMEARQWKGDAGTAIASSDRLERFYREVARGAATDGALRLHEMRLDGRLVAWGLCLGGGEALYGLKGAFDTSFAEYSPGQLRLAEEIRCAVEEGFRCHELLGSREPYKMAWTDRTRTRVGVTLVHRGLRGAPALVRHRVVRPLGRRAAGRGIGRLRIGSAEM
jgi:CelD/BcsL family acetyltransferase involved in cellulose biosynthesis